MLVNPLTGRNIALEGRTAQRLLQRGELVHQNGRLLRPSHAAFEQQAQALGLPKSVWSFPPTTQADVLEPAARAFAALGVARGRIQDGAAAPRAPASSLLEKNLLPDGFIDGVIAQTPLPRRAALDPDKHYLLRLDGALHTWPATDLKDDDVDFGVAPRPQAPGDGAVALPGGAAESVLADVYDVAALDDMKVQVEKVPAGAAVVDEPGHGRVITFYSYDNSQLEHNRGRARAAVALLNPEARYQLYSNWGQANEPFELVQWHVSSHPQGFQGRRGVKTQTVHDADDIEALVLVGLDNYRWENASHYGKVIRWELRPLPEQEGPPGPFREGALNCVLERTRERLFSGVAVANHGRACRKAGPRLQAKREKNLQLWEAKIAARVCRDPTSGFELEDIPAFEKDMQIVLECLTATGVDMAAGVQRTARQRRHMTVRLALHDNHAFAALPEAPAKITKVAIYDQQTQAELAGAREIKDDVERAKAVDAAVLAFYAREIPKGQGRSWAVGAELIHSTDGLTSTVYRTAQAARSLDTAFTDITGNNPRDGLPDELHQDYEEAQHLVGGAATYRHVEWRKREGIRPTPQNCVDAWQKAQVEAVPWMSDRDENRTAQQIDMRAAYLACDRRGPDTATYRADSEAAPEIARFGFPTASMRRASLDPQESLMPSSLVFSFAGCVQLVAWEFNAASHAFNAWRLGSHLRKSEGWITTPELYDLLESGDLVSARAREIVYSMGKKVGLQYPDASSSSDADWGVNFVGRLAPAKAERTQGVHFVGKLARRGNQNTVLTHDKNEAAYLANSLEGRFHEYVAGGVESSRAYLVRYEPQKPSRRWYHIRAFVLAYTNIALRKMLRRFRPQTVARICTDAIYATELPEEVRERLSTDESTVKWGQWRVKAPGYSWCETKGEVDVCGSLEHTPSDAPPLARDPHNIPGVDAKAVPKELTAAVLAGHSKILITGQGGCGKTYVIAKALEGRNFVIACPSNELAENHRQTLGCRAETYHKLLALPVGKPMSEWVPEKLGHRLDNIPETFVCDEATMPEDTMWEKVLPYLEKRGRQVIICKDGGQLLAFGQKEASVVHERWADVHIRFTVDMRSNDNDPIRQLKEDIWHSSNQCQIDTFRERVLSTEFAEALAEWHPRDLFICSTHKMGAEVQGRLLAEHRRRYPAELAPIRFQPDKSVERKYRAKVRDGRVPVPGTTRVAPTIKGHIEWVPLSAVDVDGLPPEWKYAGWGTVHVTQGKTVDEPRRLFIMDHKLLTFENAVYTSVSRVRAFGQLRRVLPPPGVGEYLQPVGIQAEPSSTLIAARIRSHNLSDIRAAKLGKREPVDKVARLDTEYVMGLIIQGDGKCVCCGCPLLLQGFSGRHPQAFSIDRLDDSRGHEVGNVRISCYECNIHHVR